MSNIINNFLKNMTDNSILLIPKELNLDKEKYSIHHYNNNMVSCNCRINELAVLLIENNIPFFTSNLYSDWYHFTGRNIQHTSTVRNFYFTKEDKENIKIFNIMMMV